MQNYDFYNIVFDMEYSCKYYCILYDNRIKTLITLLLRETPHHSTGFKQNN